MQVSSRYDSLSTISPSFKKILRSVFLELAISRSKFFYLNEQEKDISWLLLQSQTDQTLNPETPRPVILCAGVSVATHFRSTLKSTSPQVRVSFLVLKFSWLLSIVLLRLGFSFRNLWKVLSFVSLQRKKVFISSVVFLTLGFNLVF